jgi:hypothetical protein
MISSSSLVSPSTIVKSDLSKSFITFDVISSNESSRCSFSILPSDIPPLENEQNNDAGDDVYDSEDSFEEITSNVINDLDKSDLTIVEGETKEDDDIIDEDEVVTASTERRLSSISDEERSKISEAVSAQAKAIQELMSSNKFASISRSNSTVSGISSLDQIQIQEIQEVTEAEIQRIAQDCLDAGMIKKSANVGLEYIPPVNTRETSLDPISVLASDQSVENNPIWVDSGSDLDSTTNQIEELPSYADTMAPPTRPLPEEPEWRPSSPRPLPNVIDESDLAPAQETVLNAHATEFTPCDQYVQRDLQIDLNQDQAILENLINLDEPIQTETNRSIDFTPVNGLQQLKREFGDEYEQLYGVCLRKFDYDAVRAAEYIRKNQLTSKLLAAKMQLNDYDITPEEYSLSEMVVHIDNINEIITAYIEHEFQERTIVNVPNGRQNPPNLWDNVRQFITQSVRF